MGFGASEHVHLALCLEGHRVGPLRSPCACQWSSFVGGSVGPTATLLGIYLRIQLAAVLLPPTFKEWLPPLVQH